MLHLLLVPAGRLHWLSVLQATQVPLLLQNPESDPDPALFKVQVLFTTASTAHFAAGTLQTALLHAATALGGRLHCTSLLQPGMQAPALHTPASLLPASWHETLVPARRTLQTLVPTLHVALLHVLSVPGGSQH
jgi:hypothetical protein